MRLSPRLLAVGLSAALLLPFIVVHPATALTTYTVVNGNNSGTGSLRAAITSANADGDDSVITFSGVTTVNLDFFLPNLENNNTLTINGGSGVTVRRSNAVNFNIFNVASGANVTLSALTITGGRGGISNLGTLVVQNSIISANSEGEGGIYNENGNITIINSIISGNSKTGTGSSGAGISTRRGVVTVQNSTISGNSADSAGGIFISSGSVFTLTNSILANNTPEDCRNFGVINVQYSLIENDLEFTCPINGTNTSVLTGDPNLNASLVPNIGSPVINAGSNALVPVGVATDKAGNPRIQDGTVDMGAYEVGSLLPTVTITGGGTAAEGSTATATLTRTGSTTSAITINLTLTAGADLNASDYTLTDPTSTTIATTATIPAGSASVVLTFASLSDGSTIAEGAETLTIALSPGIGYRTGSADSATATITANGLTVINGNDAGEGSLRQAILNANTDGNDSSITFSGVTTVNLTSAPPNLANNGALTINGGSGVTVQGNSSFGLFLVLANANVTITALTISGGRNEPFVGGIANQGTLTLQNSTITGNVAGIGGGINNIGTMIVINSTISNNTGFNGGGIINSGTLTLQNTIVSNNTATSTKGDGIFNSGTLIITNSTISGNTSEGIFSNSGTVTLNNSIVANNAVGRDCVRGDSVRETVTINAQFSLIEGGLTCVNGTNTSNLTGDPNLDALLRPNSGSPVINAGSNALAVGATDRAGNPRIQGSAVDMGAFETNDTPPTATPTATPTSTATFTATATYTATNTATPTFTATSTATFTLTSSPTSTATATSTATTNVCSPSAPGAALQDTPGLYNPSNAFFLLRNFNSAGLPTYSFPYGFPFDQNIVPLVGDWNGDGVDTVGIYVKTTSAWAMSDDNYSTVYSFSYGSPGNNLIPVVGDWDGNGTDTPGLFNPANGAWLLINVNASIAPQITFLYGQGIPGLIPVPGDWDGNGSDTPGVYNPATGAWALANGLNTAPFATITYGNDPALKPVKGDYDGNNTDTIGLWNPASGAWLLTNVSASCASQLTYVYGAGNPSLLPLMGKWTPGGVGGVNGLPTPTPNFTPTQTPAPQVAPTFAARQDNRLQK